MSTLYYFCILIITNVYEHKNPYMYNCAYARKSNRNNQIKSYYQQLICKVLYSIVIITEFVCGGADVTLKNHPVRVFIKTDSFVFVHWLVTKEDRFILFEDF